MASWGDIALARGWCARSRRREQLREAERGEEAAERPAPTVDAPASDAVGPAASHAPPAADGGPPPLRVLIADDSSVFTELLLRLLAQRDWIEIVGCADNGHDAVVLAAASNPDLILMDVDMPVMDGVEAIRQIRRRAPVPVLVLTASAGPEVRERALAEGAFAVLPKSTDPTELVGHIQSVFLTRAA